MRIGAIIVAAGTGSRAGGEKPKQFQRLLSRPVYRWSVDELIRHQSIDQVVLVCPAGEVQRLSAEGPDDLIFVGGGLSRSQSVLNGLKELEFENDDLVLIHDAARPGIDALLIDKLLLALETHDCAAPALHVSDAIKLKLDSGISTVDRSNLFRVQTPQAFRFGDIYIALEDTDKSYVDDLEAVQAQNKTVAFVEGSERYGKITFPDDHHRLEAILMSNASNFRIGTGFDVHAFAEGNHVTLCGVDIPHSAKLSGHSDADVAWHALTDAILGACALGDIGDHFPPSDPQWKGAPSHIFLKHAIDAIRQEGWELSNCDLTIICEAPKIKPHREAMRLKTAELLGTSLSNVSVKATTTEQLGFTGRREGIAAQASVILTSLQT